MHPQVDQDVTSRRRVPVRSVLLKLGFMEYVQTVKVSGAKLLFPQWKPIRKKASAGAEKWFVQVLAATGLRDDTVRTF